MATIECGFEDDGRDTGSDLLAFFRPTVYVHGGFDIQFLTGFEQAPVLPYFFYPALIDTGAAESCIDSELASRLRLPIVDTQTVGSVGGRLVVNVYWAQIHIPELNIWISGRTAGVHLSAGQQPHSVLIGSDLLQHVTLVYDGRTGSVRISDEVSRP
jgi:predicted aspartyl protease